ncbi:hypothetical protein GRF59_15175 [Paenibacillus sp. HJL G12]|uniref:Uncharacterized protein n=1 Tax=Paenibacillus dendrobii TaxID=2691084 RepID=A0A7X3LIU7_9BACL|nr:hypothetical protein [Paenibacillus dendrobii]MWV44963.1 hypothetical protein [Paenibacillus dendrobii]
MYEKMLRFDVHISDVEKINPLFSKCKIRVLYAGLNRNNSYLSRKSIEEALPSMFNIPIVGEFEQETENFGGHGGAIDVSGDKPKWINTTVPYGLVPESANIYWEEVEEKDGSINEYLVVDNAFLWTGRYPEAQMLIGQQFNQSMEIEIQKGNYSNINGQKTYEVEKFLFSALCILGIDKESDPSGHVEPCFESASIVAYQLDKDKFKDDFQRMLKELKFSLNESSSSEVKINDSQGGNKVEEILKMLEPYSLTLEDLQAKGINHEDFSLEELEDKVKTEFTVADEGSPSENKTPNTFTLTGSQLFEEVSREISNFGSIVDEYWGFEYPKYALVDIDTEKSHVIAYDYEKWYTVGFSYSVTGDKVSIDQASMQRFKVNYVPMDLSTESPTLFSESIKNFANQIKSHSEERTKNRFESQLSDKDQEIESLNQTYKQLQEEFSKVSSEYSTKLQKEREDVENALFSSFANELSEEEMKPVKESKEQFTLEQIEEKLFTLVGKKKAKLNFSIETKPVIDIEIKNEKVKKSGKSYDVLFED